MKFASFFYIIVLGGESVSNRKEILNLFRKILSSLLCINMETSNECLKENVDYERVHRNLEKIREQSYNYLRKALEDKESTDFK